jgi:hypothetical protein
MKLNPQVFRLAAELLDTDFSIRFSCNAICFTRSPSSMHLLGLPTVAENTVKHEEFYQKLMSPDGKRLVITSDFEGPPGYCLFDDSTVPESIREHRVLALLLAAAVCESDAELDETRRLVWTP